MEDIKRKLFNAFDNYLYQTVSWPIPDGVCFMIQLVPTKSKVTYMTVVKFSIPPMLFEKLLSPTDIKVANRFQA